MNYQTYEISITSVNNTLKFVEVMACSLSAAHADIRECYGDDVEIVSSRML